MPILQNIHFCYRFSYTVGTLQLNDKIGGTGLDSWKSGIMCKKENVIKWWNSGIEAGFTLWKIKGKDDEVLMNDEKQHPTIESLSTIKLYFCWCFFQTAMLL